MMFGDETFDSDSVVYVDFMNWEIYKHVGFKFNSWICHQFEIIVIDFSILLFKIMMAGFIYG